MPKPLFQDIVPPDKRSIKKIPIPERKRDARPAFPEPQTPRYEPPRPVAKPKVQKPVEMPVYGTNPQNEVNNRTYQPEYHSDYYKEETQRPVQQQSIPRKRKSRARIVLTLIILACIAALFVVLTQKASGAKLVLTPKGEAVAVDAQFNAVKETAVGVPDNTLGFQTETISKDGTLAVPSNGEEKSEVKARGTIIIYNNFSSEPQKLIANTRFETPAGLIFRITQPVTIPGRKTEAGKSVPGSIEAQVTADAAGPSYNIGLTDFTVPGFKGDPRFEKIYARTKTSIQGGFSGMRKKVSETDAAAGREKIQAELKTALIRQAEQDIPAGYIMPAQAFTIEYETLPNNDTGTGVELSERATLHGIIFKRTDLAEAISEKARGPESKDPSDLLGIENLTFAPTATTSSLWNADRITFTLKGTTTLISAFNADGLKEELVGKPRKNLNAILTAYTGIVKADVTVSPFWKRSFPDKAEDITISVAAPELSP